MTLTELKKLLDQTGFPVAYDHFNSAPSIPFITYLDAGTTNLIADNKVHKKINNVDVELYTNKKDVEAEEKLEKILDENEIPWQSYPDIWIEDEKIYQKIYEIGVI